MNFPGSSLLRPSKDSLSRAPPPPGKKPLDLGPIIKSPLDSKAYKAIQLPNGLKALLVSTCQHELEGGKSNDGVLNEKIKEFNSLHLGLNSGGKGGGSGGRGPSSGNQKPSSSSFFQSLLEKTGLAAAASLFPEQTEKPSEPEPPNKKARLLRCCGGPATVAVVVGVGAFYDPVDAYGLAHLVEHLIFLGSANYPEPNTLFMETFRNHGIANATTFAEHTMFYFSCTSDALENCLNILIDGLVNANLKDEVIKNEIKAIDSEYGIKQTCDATRLDDFIRSRAKSKHPMRSFYWGNADTLKYPKLGNIVREWKARYYRADYMTVCIQAPFPIRELEKMAMAQFSGIPPSDTVPPLSSRMGLLSRGEPFDEKGFYTSYYIAPLTHTTCLMITWFLSANFWKDYTTKPLHYIRQMLGATYPGSLISYLKTKRWLCDSMNVEVNCKCTDNFCRNSFGSLFTMKFFLTDEGYENRHYVVSSIFSYLKLLKTRGVSKSVFQEMQRTQADYFHFQNWEEMVESCISAAMALQEEDAPAKFVLTSQNLSMEYNDKTIKECLEEMSPRRANILFVCSKNQEICKEKAWACKIRYKKETIAERRYRELENIKIYKEFKPPPEKYFQSQKIVLGNTAELCKKSTKDFESDRLSVKFLSSKKSPCLSRQVPSASYYVVFSSPNFIRQLRIKEGMLDLWIKVAVDNIAEMAGHRFNEFISYNDILTIASGGLAVELSGPSFYLPELLKIVVKGIFELDNCYDSKFESYKKDLVCVCANSTFDTEFLCRDIVSYLQLSNHSSIFQLKQHAEELDYECFGRLANLFKQRMKVFVDLQGDVFESDREAIIDLLNGDWFKPAIIIPKIQERSTVIPRGTSLVSVQGIHPGYITSAVMNYYQVGISDSATWEMTHTLYRVLKRRLPNQLRTVEQLGYTVQLRLFDDHGSIGLVTYVLTHPHKFSTEYVDARVDDFFKAFHKIIKDEKKRKKLFADFFADDVGKIKEMKTFYEDHFLQTGKNFKKLSVQVKGYYPDVVIGKKRRQELRGERNKDDDDDSDELIQLEYLAPEGDKYKRPGFRIIENVHAFRTALELYPVARI